MGIRVWCHLHSGRGDVGDNVLLGRHAHVAADSATHVGGDRRYFNSPNQLKGLFVAFEQLILLNDACILPVTLVSWTLPGTKVREDLALRQVSLCKLLCPYPLDGIRLKSLAILLLHKATLDGLKLSLAYELIVIMIQH